MLISKKNIIKFIIIVLLVALLILYYLTRPKTASLTVESIPQTKIFIDGEYKGDTPKEIEVKPGEIVLRLEPLEQKEPYSNYETRVKTVAGVKTIVRRILGEEEEKASGEIISFKKTNPNSSDLSVISTPDAAQVLVDNKFIDSTPLKVSNLSPGVHTIEVKAQGYQSREFDIQMIKGYKLTAIVQLSRIVDTASFLPSNLVQSDPVSDEVSDEDVIKVKILSTPTDYLRVRELPTTNSNEVDQVRPGQSFEYLETSEDELWYKIKIDDNIMGWVSTEYSELLDDGSGSGSSI